MGMNLIYKKVILPNKNTLYYSRYKDVSLGITYLKESGIYGAVFVTRKKAECRKQECREKQEAELWLYELLSDYLVKDRREYEN